MTEERLPLNELLRKAGDGDFLRAVAESVLQLLMEADVEGLIGDGRHERAADRLNWRNGYRDRTLDTRLGSLNLKIPKLRAGSYFPPFLEARKTTEKALVAVIQEAWIGGVSTRRVDEIAQAMGLSGISKSQVSKLCKEIDERVKAFLERPLEGDWPYLWLDATYLKVREGGRIVSVAAIIAVAANTEGRREIVRARHWSVGSRDLLGGLPEAPHQTRPARRQACDLGRARRAEGRRPAGRRRDMATLSRALHAQCAGLRAKDAGDGCRRRHPPGLHPARSRDRGPGLAARRRSAAAPVRETRQVDGRGRA